MLKGLKVKKQNKKEDVNEPKISKKWKKNNEEPQKKEEETIQSFEDQMQEKEKQLLQTCDDTWSAFIEGNKTKAIKLCQDLYIKQQVYFEKVFKGEKAAEKNYLNLFQKEELEMQSQQPSEINLASKNSLNFDSKDMDTKLKAEKIKALKKHNYDSSAIDFFNKYKATEDIDELINNEYDENNLKEQKDAEGKQVIKKSKKDEKYEERQHKREEKKEKREQNNTEKVLSSCKLCLANNQIQQEQIISMGTSTILMLPRYQRYQNIFHVDIVPWEHYSSLTDIDEEVFDEMRNFMKCLVAAFDKQNKDVIFMENAVKLKKLPHCIIECVIIPRSFANKAELYFRKELNELGGDWSVHKQKIEIRKDKGGIRKQIPKNFPYFYVDFNLAFGYANIIENEEEFSKTFGHEIICTMLNLDKPRVLYPEKASKKELFDKKIQFQKDFEKFDWTKML